jgi:UDP-N-acetylmuramate-alanine ligase
MRADKIIRHHSVYELPLERARKRAAWKLHRYTRTKDFYDLAAYINAAAEVDEMLITERCARRAVGLDDKDAA